MVAQTNGVGNNLGKMGVTGRLAIAGKGEHIGQLAGGYHLLEFGFELLGYLLTGGEGE